ncbi:uncharacterized protein LOC115632764 [Scaptodrosophila lebanonensis]|uniref:Uncharacterized protein LOC115632764 n=1 Tax=Drosophila lebanonensis TaxID=7225 RepID=A0A6J2UFJ0_DROLE|nr:uncharacterized protein LOC115632764 [Scaptodrosophila lebanonensis]
MPLEDILRKANTEQTYDTLLLLSHSRESECMLHRLSAGIVPVLQFNEDASYYLSGSFNSEMLAVVCISKNEKLNEELWSGLARNLHNMRRTRVVLILPEGGLKDPLQQIAKMSRRHKILRVVVLWQPAAGNETCTLQRLHPFPKEHFVQLPCIGSDPMFIKIDNYYGKSVYTMPDQIVSRSFVYKDPKTGKHLLSGYIAKLFLEFIRWHNLTLKWQSPDLLGKKIPLIALRNLTLNGILDMPISLSGFQLPSAIGVFSYPFEVSKWFVMVPCPREITTAGIYLMVASSGILVIVVGFYFIFSLLDTIFGCVLLHRRLDWSSLLFNERVISDIMGQSLLMRAHNHLSSRVANAQLFLLGLLVSTLFAAFLKTLLTKHPTEPAIENFQQLRDAPIHIYFDETERFYFDSFSGYRPVDQIRDRIEYLNSNLFYSMRSDLNQSNAFSISYSEWVIIAKRQQLFTRPAMCYTHELIFGHHLLMSIAMEANSIYEQNLNRLIHQVHSSGLTRFWRDQTVRDLVSVGLISLHEPNPIVAFHELKCESYDKSFVGFKECKLKVIGRGIVGLYLHAELFQLPVTNVTLNLSLWRKYNGYRPFLYNKTVDVCQFSAKRNPGPSFVKVFFDMLLENSNINHTCPYDHDIIVERMVFLDKYLKLMPLPAGEYKFQIKLAAYNDWKADVNAFILRTE